MSRVPIDLDSKPERRVFVTRGALWFGVLAPPVLALLLSPDVTRVADAERFWLLLIRKVIAIALYTNALMFAQAFAFNEGLGRVGLARLPRLVQFIVCAFTSVAIVVVCTLVLAPILRIFSPGMIREPLELIIQGVIISGLWLGSILTWNRLVERIRTEQAKAHAEQLAALDARVRLLQVRTNPHFLYNSLNTVMSLIAINPELAEETLGRLAGLFRYSLEQSSRPAVALEEELRIVGDYLSVEKIRFGDRLSYAIDVPEELADVCLPPMLLQPLVENAVKHGTATSLAGGRVTVSARAQGGDLLLAVSDDGPGPNGSAHRGTGTSVQDLRERLALLYGDETRLSTGEAKGGGYLAELRVPLRGIVP
jgi:two-component system, LytTR family, sensor histidine kinase AlgZ